MKERTYIAIDLKSFYASVECRERGLDPLDTNLVVADESRTDKTICLAVTPSLKSYGISGRGRLLEVKQRVKEANEGRRHDAPGRKLEGAWRRIGPVDKSKIQEETLCFLPEYCDIVEKKWRHLPFVSGLKPWQPEGILLSLQECPFFESLKYSVPASKRKSCPQPIFYAVASCVGIPEFPHADAL